jgi:hypothetical protein
MEKGRIVRNFGFYEEDIERVQRLSDLLGISKSKVVRKALEELEDRIEV